MKDPDRAFTIPMRSMRMLTKNDSDVRDVRAPVPYHFGPPLFTIQWRMCVFVLSALSMPPTRFFGWEISHIATVITAQSVSFQVTSVPCIFHTFRCCYL